LVNSTTIPFQLDVNKSWMGYMIYNDEAQAYRAKGQLYIGVISAHSNKNYLVKVPPEKKDRIPMKRSLSENNEALCGQSARRF
jgi:hypothetical protein